MTLLCELGKKYKTDKTPLLGYHYYTLFYYELLKDKRYTVKKVFEMGIGNVPEMAFLGWHYKPGASLRMWRDFFPNAMIYGADILPEVLFKEDRIETFLCDERDSKSVASVLGKIGSDIDLFIDDGSHDMITQINLCKYAMPLLKRDVIYIIEDVHQNVTIKRALAKVGYKTYLADSIRRGKRDKLLIIKP
jgi:hypothetical protein